MAGRDYHHNAGVPIKSGIFALLAALSCLPACASSVHYKVVKTIPLQSEFKTRRDWQVTASETAEKDSEFSTVPTRICFRARNEESLCTHIRSALPNDGDHYEYQHAKELSIVQRPHLIKFMAEFSAAGSGWLDQITFWRYDASTDLFEQAGLITLTEQGEYQLFEDKGLLVTAEARWSSGETHFSPHYFEVTVYRYEADQGYEKLFSYVTAKKYPSLDDVEKIDVISHEIGAIEKRLVN